jgi:hypothetical protein
MNHYQKVLACIFRSIGILVFGYLLITVIVLSVVMGGMWNLVGVLPMAVIAAVLFFAAVPIAKLVTIGIAED